MDLRTWLRANWDRALGAALTGAGVLAVVLGYLGVKDTPYPAEQLPYVVSGAVLGVALLGIGLTAWLSADLRDEWHKLDRIERLLEDGARSGDGGGDEDASGSSVAAEDPTATAVADEHPEGAPDGNGATTGAAERRSSGRSRRRAAAGRT